MRHIISALLYGVALWPLGIASADEARDRLIVETVLRLESFEYATASDKVKGAIGRYLESNRGSEAYFDLVSRFSIDDQLPTLAELAAGERPDPKAAALLVKLGGAEGIRKALADAGDTRPGLVAALGSVNEPEAVDVLVSLLQEADIDREAAKALAGSPAGQGKLLQLAAAGELPDGLKAGVGVALASSADPKVRGRAAALLPMPSALGGEALPPVADLVSRKGDPAKGQLVYSRACSVCHKVGDKGIDFGPALGGIGAKLAREALYTAILDPNEAISFGYEGFTVTTGGGTTLVGYVASDGESELGMKVPGGALISTAKTDVASKTPIGVSLMPSNLQATMSADELVDLVEYLTTLKG